jgi:hypothetical protein
MKTIELTDQTGDSWRAIVEAIQAGGEPVALTLEGTICGLLLPEQDARRMVAYLTPATPREAPSVAMPGRDDSRDYLELLRDDPTLVPVVDGEQLEFMTMMNSSYVDPEQIYQFKHPRTRQIYVYRASELRQALGRWFANVDFIPARPKDFVEGKR